MARLPSSKAPFVRVQTGIAASKNSLDNNKPAGEEGDTLGAEMLFQGDQSLARCQLPGEACLSGGG